MRYSSLFRTGAVLLSAFALSSCKDGPVAPGGSGVQLMISLASQVTATRTVDVAISYVAGSAFTSLTTATNLAATTGNSSVSLQVDLTKCLTDPNHSGGANVCQLVIVVTLRDASGQALDVVTLPVVNASPGAVAQSPQVNVAAVASITVSGLASAIVHGSQAQASAIVRDAAGATLTRTLAWTSLNTAIASVNGNGLVTGVSPGSTQIRTTAGNFSQLTNVTVIPAVANVTVSPPSASIQVGDTVRITGTPRDGGGNALTGRVVTYSSSNPAVATVNPSTGTVTGVAPGSVTITATSEGRTGTATVSVSQATLSSLNPSSMSANHSVGVTSCPQTIGTLSLTNVSSGQISWSASTPSSALTLQSPVSGTLAAGGRADVIVRFNCTTQSSFSSTVTFQVNSAVANESRTATVTMTISP
jgi:hypothetical protein